ncbi:hypothetical protein Tco_0604047 [Tanacetum coccineum]
METPKSSAQGKKWIKKVVVHMYRYQVNPKVSHLHALKRIFRASLKAWIGSLNKRLSQFLGCRLISGSRSEENRQWLQIPQKKLEDLATSSCCRLCFGFGGIKILDYGIDLNGQNPTNRKNVADFASIKLFDNGIEVNAGDSMLMLLGITYYCCVKVNAVEDGKKIIITESTVRRDLQLEDAEGVDCLTNSTIFEQLTLMGSKTTAWNEFSSTMELGDSLVRAATTASSLEEEQDNGNITKTRSKATPNESSSLGITSGGAPWCQETMGDTTAQTRFESVSKYSNDSLLARGNTLQSDEDRLKLEELMALCNTLQNRVLDLEKTMTS